MAGGKPKKDPNLKRSKQGPWNGDTFNTAEPIVGVTKEGWCLVGGKNHTQSTLYLDGKPVPHVAALDYQVTAGEAPQLTIRIVLPNLTVITRND